MKHVSLMRYFLVTDGRTNTAILGVGCKLPPVQGSQKKQLKSNSVFVLDLHLKAKPQYIVFSQVPPNVIRTGSPFKISIHSQVMFGVLEFSKNNSKMLL